MIKILSKFTDHSENIELVRSRITQVSTDQIVIEQQLHIKVTFKDWWNFFTGKDCIHTTTKTIIEYEEDNTTSNIDTTNTDKPSKKSTKSRKSKTSDTTL